MYNLGIKILIVISISLVSNVKSFSQNSQFKKNEIDSIFRSRGYSLWQNENDGIIEFEKKITKKITNDDILNSQKYYGCKCDKDTRLTEEDLGLEYKVKKKGLVSSETLAEIIPAEFDYFDNIFNDNKLLAKKDNYYFLFNRSGQEVNQELIKDYIHIDVRCSQDYNEYDCEFRRVRDKSGNWGYTNQNWKTVIPCIYEELSFMRNGYGTGKLNGKIGIINNKGNFNQIDGQSIECFPIFETIYTTYTSNNKKGVVDNNAKIIINPKYDDIKQERDCFIVKLNGKWGVINELDSVQVPIKYIDIVQSGKSLDDISIKLHKDSSFISYKILQENTRIAKEKIEEDNKGKEGQFPIKDEKYNEVKIGTQIWMSKNLNIDHFKNGDLIMQAKSTDEWVNAGLLQKPAWCYYDFNSQNGNQFGKLYNWYAVNDIRGLAPEGWLIPTNNEWDILTNFLGGEELAAKKVKSTLYGGSNITGFNALNAGYILENGYFSTEIGKNGNGYWWSNTSVNENLASFMHLLSSSSYSYFMKTEDPSSKNCGYSVRCYKKAKTGSNISNSNSNNQTINQNLANEDCSVIVREYEKFASDYIKYCGIVKTKPHTTNIYEFSDWEKKQRKMQDLVMKCVDDLNRNRILATMSKVYVALEAILGVSKSTLSNNANNIASNNSNNKPKSTSVSSQNNSQNSSKTEKEQEDFDNRQGQGHEAVKQSANCKHCGNTIFVQRNVPISPKIRSTFNESGGITGICNKCSKMTSFTYEINKGKFIKLNRTD